jgi:hypothetical protein
MIEKTVAVTSLNIRPSNESGGGHEVLRELELLELTPCDERKNLFRK